MFLPCHCEDGRTVVAVFDDLVFRREITAFWLDNEISFCCCDVFWSDGNEEWWLRKGSISSNHDAESVDESTGKIEVVTDIIKNVAGRGTSYPEVRLNLHKAADLHWFQQLTRVTNKYKRQAAMVLAALPREVIFSISK